MNDDFPVPVLPAPLQHRIQLVGSPVQDQFEHLGTYTTDASSNPYLATDSLTNHLRRVAVHEAGHGVARLRLFPDQYFEHISIEENDETFGRLVLAFDTTKISANASIEDAEDLFMKDAVSVCAGYAACVVAGFSQEQALTGCEWDFERAGHRKERACQLALELLGRDENVRAVTLIADKLIELATIDYDHIGVLMQLADGDCSEEEYHQYLEFRTDV